MDDDELWEKCRTDKPITCEDLGLSSWRSDTDGFIYECGMYNFYKVKDGYRHTNGKPVSKFLRWFYDLD